jgi:hypothetical protein
MPGQCQIYREKLIFPINTIGGLERIFLLKKLESELMIRIVPRTGSSAQKPGNVDFSLIKTNPAVSNKTPSKDNKLWEILKE